LTAPVWIALVAVNIAAFASFGIDKRRARAGERRLREVDLLLFALIGGTVGAYLGRWHFRHKTRKRGFSFTLHLVAIAQIVLLILFAP
jgi:uncharacterized membrane protein YsdA (DUF1294 family)